MEQHKAIFDSVYMRLERELPSFLVYHNLAHTQEVVQKAGFLADIEGLSSEEYALVQIAALFHDTGFLWGKTNHEQKSCRYAKSILSDSSMSPSELELVCGMIMATKLPQRPRNLLDKILADADLFYLGTDAYTIHSDQLFMELTHYEPELEEDTWLQLQREFLSSHQYHTTYGRANLQRQQEENLKSLK